LFFATAVVSCKALRKGLFSMTVEAHN